MFGEGDLLGGSEEVTWPFQLQSQPFGMMLLYCISAGVLQKKRQRGIIWPLLRMKGKSTLEIWPSSSSLCSYCCDYHHHEKNWREDMEEAVDRVIRRDKTRLLGVKR